jgi:Fe(3+) dicitrate transport protein
VFDTTIAEQRERARTFALVGLGITYALDESELYANISQNYRSITFSDLRIDNPNLVVDQDITDERGFTADVGLRGMLTPWLTADVSAFYLRYDDRIGQVLRADQGPTYLPYRYRTNIADAYTAGVEAVGDLDVNTLLDLSTAWPSLRVLTNISMLRGAYINTDDASIRERQVELVPPFTLRCGVMSTWNALQASLLVAHVAKHYSDATNAEVTATAVNGAIPSYTVVDASLRYQLSSWSLTLSANNVFDARYFTRRAESYPGPGIIPADARTLTATVEWQFGRD